MKYFIFVSILLSQTSVFAKTYFTCSVTGKVPGSIHVQALHDVAQMPATVTELSPFISSLTFVHSITKADGSLGTESEVLYGAGIRGGVMIDRFSCGGDDSNRFDRKSGAMDLSSTCNSASGAAMNRVFFDANLSLVSSGSIKIHVTGNDEYRLIETEACK